MREIRTLRVMWRGLETASRAITELPRQFPTLPGTVDLTKEAHEKRA